MAAASGPTVLWLLTVVGGLEVWREFIIGDDLVTGAVAALAAVVWTLRAADAGPDGSGWYLPAAAVALGVTTCTRPHWRKENVCPETSLCPITWKQ